MDDLVLANPHGTGITPPVRPSCQVLALQNGNGQLLTFEGLANGDLRSNNSQMIVRGAGWRQDVCVIVPVPVL